MAIRRRHRGTPSLIDKNSPPIAPFGVEAKITMKQIWLALALGSGLHLAAQPSSLSLSGKQGEEAVEIRNVTYELAGKIVLRKTEQTRQVIGDKGMEASSLIEAWPLGVDRKQKPKYSLKVDGVDARSLSNELLIVTRGLEDTEWWSLYRLSDGQPLFDTFVRPVRIPDSSLYAGLDVPADGDPRLKNPKLIGIVTLAGAADAPRRIEIHANDAKRAVILRSYADVTPSMEFNYTRKVLVLTLRNAQPDARIEIPLNGPAVIRCCDIVAR